MRSGLHKFVEWSCLLVFVTTALLWIQSLVLGVSVKCGYRSMLGLDGSEHNVSAQAANMKDFQLYDNKLRIRRYDYILSSEGGRLLIAFGMIQRPEPMGYHISDFRSVELDPQWMNWESEWFPFWSWLANEYDPVDGFSYPTRGILGIRFSPNPTQSGWNIAVPYWLPMLLAGVPLPWTYIRYRQRRLALATTQCARCGYDLRASPARCPECGYAIHRRTGRSH